MRTQHFYLSTHTGRRLTWQLNMGHADLKATFGSVRHELNVSTYQVRTSVATGFATGGGSVGVREAPRSCSYVVTRLYATVVSIFRITGKHSPDRGLSVCE